MRGLSSSQGVRLNLRKIETNGAKSTSELWKIVSESDQRGYLVMLLRWLVCMLDRLVVTENIDLMYRGNLGVR